MLDGTRQQGLCYHTFMAKRKPVPRNRGMVSPFQNAAQARFAAQIQNRPSFVQELKSFVDPGNLTGANQIAAAISGKGSVKSRITSGLTGVVSGLLFAGGGGVPHKYRNDIGLHVSPNPNIKNKIVFSPATKNTGAKGGFDNPVIEGQTYKFPSAKKINQGLQPINSNLMIHKLRRYGEEYFSSQGYTAYVTKSKYGRVDPEAPKSGLQRIVPEQSIISKIDYPGGGVGRTKDGWNMPIKNPVLDKQLSQEILKARRQVTVEAKLINAQAFLAASIASNKLNQKNPKRR
jgi:hypothetical protein